MYIGTCGVPATDRKGNHITSHCGCPNKQSSVQSFVTLPNTIMQIYYYNYIPLNAFTHCTSPSLPAGSLISASGELGGDSLPELAAAEADNSACEHKESKTQNLSYCVNY